MRKQHLSGAPLLAALALVVVVPAAQAAGPLVAPVPYEKNKTCEDFGYTTITKFDPPNTGTQNGVTLTRVDGSHVNWTSTVPVDAVMVKGGDGGNLYAYALDTFADENLVTPDNASGGPAGLSHVNFCTDGEDEPQPNPGIDLEKSVDKDVAYVGETLNYTLTVTNTGNTVLNEVDLTDVLCDSEPVRSGENAGDVELDPGDVWTYTCSHVVPEGTSEVENVAEVCYGSTTPATGEADRCDTDTVVTPVEKIGIAVVKDAVETTAVAGTTVHFKISVTNTGTTTFTTYELADDNCDELRTGDNAGDSELDPGEVWTYDCAMATEVGDRSADNTAKAKGTDENGKEAEGQDDATIPLTQPKTPGGETPGGTTPGGTTPGGTTPHGTTPGGTTPGAGGTLPETLVSGRARLRGPSGCVKRAFRARVSGRRIASVTFYVDGKLVKTYSGRRAGYSIKVNLRRYGLGRHRIVARVTFVSSSGTKARRLPLTFRRCAKGAIAPRFTG